MARLLYPDEASVERVQATAGTALLSAASTTARVYVDAAGTELADITNADGSANPTATLTLDSLSRLPLFYGPTSGVGVLYVRVDGGAPLPVYAQTRQLIDALDADVDERIAASEAQAALLYAPLDGVEVVQSHWDFTYLPTVEGAPINQGPAGPVGPPGAGAHPMNSTTWALAEMDTAGKVARYVDMAGKTWLKLHEDAVMPESLTDRLPRPGVNGYAFLLTDTAGRLSDLAIDHNGRFAPLAAARLGAPRKVDLRSFLDQHERLPNDGVGSASALLQRAVNSIAADVPTTGPVQLYVPPGRYRIGTRLTWASGVGLAGAGRQETVFLPEKDQSFIHQPGANDGTFLDDCHFSDFTVDGAAQTNATYSTFVKGIFIQYMRRARFERVTIVNTWATGFGVDHLQDSSFVSCYAAACGRGLVELGLDRSLESGGSGFGIGTGAVQNESITMVDCIAINNGLHGFFTEKQTAVSFYSRGFRMSNCWSAGNWIGFRDCGSEDAIIAGCHFVNNTYCGVSLDKTILAAQAGYNGLLVNCVIRGNGAGEPTKGAGVVIGKAALGRYTLTGNSIIDNRGPGVHVPGDGTVARGYLLRGNTIASNDASGVLVESTTRIHRLLLADNEIVGNGRSGTATTRDGLRISSALTTATLTGNRVYDEAASPTQQTGIHLSGTPSDVGVVVRRNDVRGNVTGGLTITHTLDDPTLVSDNIGA